MPVLSDSHPLRDGRTRHSPLVRAARGERPSHTPVWFMRQAGRSLPEYRALREGVPMLDACLDPAMASEITLQPVRRHGVDAAVFFSDIVIPVLLAGVDVQIVPGRGPVLDTPVRSAEAIAALPELDADAFAPISAAVALTVEQLGETPLIGFAGAPYTLASYLVEGGPSKDQLLTRSLMHSDPESWARLAAWCARASGAFLRAQVLAGASVVQLFDSWAGTLSRTDYEDLAAPHSASALAAIADLDVPRIHFGLGLGGTFDIQRGIGADVIGVDWRLPLDEAAARTEHAVPLQGNIDPALLDAPWPVLSAHVDDVLRRGETAPAHIANLGHGVPPTADPRVLTRIVEYIHDR